MEKGIILSTKELALQKVLAMFLSLLLIIGIALVFHFPQVSLSLAMSAFLTSSVFWELPSQQEKIRVFIKMILALISLQFTIGFTENYRVVQLLAAVAVTFCIFEIFDNRAAGLAVLLVGYVSFFTKVSFESLLNNCFEFFMGMSVAAMVSLFRPKQVKAQAQQFSKRTDSLKLTMETLLALITAELFHLKQGVWVVLTIFFIQLAKGEGNQLVDLVKKRILAVPAGLFCGILFLSVFTYLNYQFFYIIPLLGGIGFFLLFSKGDFLGFSLFFMFTFMIFGDYKSGVLKEFHPWQFLFARSLATLIGAVIAIVFDKYWSLGKDD